MTNRPIALDVTRHGDVTQVPRPLDERDERRGVAGIGREPAKRVAERRGATGRTDPPPVPRDTFVGREADQHDVRLAAVTAENVTHARIGGAHAAHTVSPPITVRTQALGRK